MGRGMGLGWGVGVVVGLFAGDARAETITSTVASIATSSIADVAPGAAGIEPGGRRGSTGASGGALDAPRSDPIEAREPSAPARRAAIVGLHAGAGLGLFSTTEQADATGPSMGWALAFSAGYGVAEHLDLIVSGALDQELTTSNIGFGTKPRELFFRELSLIVDAPDLLYEPGSELRFSARLAAKLPTDDLAKARDRTFAIAVDLAMARAFDVLDRADLDLELALGFRHNLEPAVGIAATLLTEVCTARTGCTLETLSLRRSSGCALRSDDVLGCLGDLGLAGPQLHAALGARQRLSDRFQLSLDLHVLRQPAPNVIDDLPSTGGLSRNPPETPELDAPVWSWATLALDSKLVGPLGLRAALTALVPSLHAPFTGGDGAAYSGRLVLAVNL